MFVLPQFLTETVHLPFAADSKVLAAGHLFLRLFSTVVLYNIAYY